MLEVSNAKRADSKFIFANDGVHPTDKGHSLIARFGMGRVSYRDEMGESHASDF
jgi:phospholipase/lecithinase/hemolysin